MEQKSDQKNAISNKNILITSLSIIIIFTGISYFILKNISLKNIPNLAQVSSSLPNPLSIWNGETAESRNAGHEYGRITSSIYYEGGYSFEGAPDPWHSPTISLGGQSAWRADISQYDYISFYAKSDQTGKTFNFSVSGWPSKSNDVNINSYIDGGALDTTWRLVKIPLSDLKNSSYNFSSIELLSFGLAQPANSAHKIYIDQIVTGKDVVVAPAPAPVTPTPGEAYPTPTPISETINAIKIYDGEIAKIPSSTCLEYDTETLTGGLNGGKGLKLSSDRWHLSYYKIYCGGNSRLDLSPYNYITFYIKSTGGDQSSRNFWLNSWAAGNGNTISNKVNIALFTEGGVIDSVWRPVRIPTTALKTPAWNLRETDGIFFDTFGNNQVFIDNIVASNTIDDTIVIPSPIIPPIVPASPTINLYDGVNTKLISTASRSCLANGNEIANVGYNTPTGAALKLTPNKWSGSVFMVYCGGRSRQDWSSLSSLQFYVKTDATSPTDQYLSLYTYAGPSGVASSKQINIKTYITGGAITRNWLLVNIPLSDLKTTTWNLTNVDEIRFSTSQNNSVFYIDDIGVYGSATTVVTAVAPIISAISATTATTGATISWITDNSSDTQVEYGLTTAYGSNSALNSTMITTHSVVLSGLANNTIYHYRVKSKNAANLLATSNDQIFRTVSALVSTKFTIGDRVQVNTTALNVRDAASGGSLGTQALNSLGSILGGPTVAGGYSWWNINFDIGADGWSAEDFLNKFTTPLPDLPLPPPLVTGSVDLSKQFRIWTGEVASDRGATVTEGGIVSSGANSGTYALKLDPPDQWHLSGLYLTNLDAYRKSITSYDFIQMAIKVAPKPGTVLPTSPVVRFSIYGWQEGGDNTSNEVNVGNYIVGGGSLDSTYKIVRIPISALEKIGGFKAFTMEIMRFDGSGTETPSYSIYVDDIYAVDKTPNSISSYKTLSNNSFKLVTKERYDMNAVSDFSQYSLRSDSDPNYSAARNPVKLGKESYVTGFEGSVGGSWGRDHAPLVESNLYLIFDRPLKNGVSYTLTINHLSDTRGNDLASPKTITFNYNDATVNGTVKASQVGYLPASPKFAYIGNYTGDAGSLTISPTECQIRNAADGSLFKTYSAAFRGNDLKLSGEMVYDCDFSDLTTVGTYYVYIPGYGKTYNFRIGNDVYADVTQKLLKLFYFQRANTAITSTYGGQWARPAGTPGDSEAVLHSSNYSSSLNPLMSSSDPASGATLDMTGGWYDAGDYGKYILTAAPTINDLLFAYELFPSKFFDGQNNIPESGNGIPDILDEVKYEIDWFSKMQAPDGGVFDRLASQTWLANPYDTKQRFLVPKSTHDTAVYAAVLAQAYRVFKGNSKFEEKYPGYADALLRKAEKAWDFLTAHPLPAPANGISVSDLGIGPGSGDYQDSVGSNCPDGVAPPSCPYSDVDNRAWAAAELYKSTGVETYQTAFKRYWPQTSPFYRPDNNFIFHNSKASYAYVTTTAYSTDATIVANIKTALKSIVGNPSLPINGSGDDWYNHTYSNIYRNAYRSDVANYICWGAYAQSSIKAFDLIKAAIILGDNKYLDAAKINLDTELGTNPQYKSYITGVGVDYPKNPLHLTSFWLRQNSGATAPVPGIPVYGPCSWGTGANSYNSQAQRDGNIYPSLQNGIYPILRRYFDISGMVEQSEFAINSIAPIAAAYAYFSR